MNANYPAFVREKLASPGATRLAFGVVAIAVLGSALVFVAGSNPLTALAGIFAGAFGERYTIAETLVSAIPLALIGLSVAPALRAGVFTVGSEGQLAIGAMCATAAIFAAPHLPPLALALFAAISGAVGGAAWALLPALLRAYGRVNEILSTLLLNYIAGFFLLWSLRTWLATPEIVPLAQSAPLPDAALIPKLLDGTRLHWGFVLLPIAALVLAWWLRSARGFAYQVVATHPALASRMGLTQARAVLTTMLVSGAVAGLAGWLQVAGVAGTLYPGVAGGFGFAGVLVALLGRLNPIGILVASFFFAAIDTGADGLQAGTGIPSAISIIVQGLVLLVATLSIAAQGVRKPNPHPPATPLPARAQAEFEGAQS